MEDNFSRSKGEGGSDLFFAHYQKMFSEIWISDVYEIARLLRTRKLAEEIQGFEQLFADLSVHPGTP